MVHAVHWSYMLTKQDLTAIDSLMTKRLSEQDKHIDVKFAEQDKHLEQRFDEKLKPINKKLNTISRKLKVAVEFFDTVTSKHVKQIKRIENHLDLPPFQEYA